MMSNSLKKITILSLLSLTTNAILFGTKPQTAESTTAKTPSKEITPMRMDCPEMTILNKFLELKPINALRLKTAYGTAREIMKTLAAKETKTEVILASAKEPEKTPTTTETKGIETSQKTEKQPEATKTDAPKVEPTKISNQQVLEFKKKLLDPINSFFGNLYDQQKLLSPLVVKIFEDTGYVKNKEELSNTLMIKFFFIPKEQASTYFYDILKTKEDFLKVCEEFEVLFGVVNVSLSDEVIKKAAELEKKAIDAKKQQLANAAKKVTSVNQK